MSHRELLQNPRLFQKNRLSARSDHVSCFAGEETPRAIHLDGVWKFHYCNDLEQRVHGFEQDLKISDPWDDIGVPENWLGETVRIQFESVEPAFFFYCNGRLVGYSFRLFKSDYLSKGIESVRTQWDSSLI